MVMSNVLTLPKCEMVSTSLTSIFRHLSSNCINRVDKRKLWGFVAIAFNRVDADRLNLVGADRLCAEWVLKNGGAVRFTTSPNLLVNNYNMLPPENIRLRLKEVDASDSSIMKIGMDHLHNCEKIDKIILHNCKHLEEGSLDGLLHVKASLNHLQVSGCYNFAGGSLLPIKDLSNLKELKIFDLPYVKNMDQVSTELRKALPNCNMEISK